MPRYRNGNGLTPKMKAYCDILLSGQAENGQEAAIKAYGCGKESGRVIAWENNKREAVIEYFRVHAPRMSEHMTELALKAKSENVQYQATKTSLEFSGLVEVPEEKGGNTFLIGIFQKIYAEERGHQEEKGEGSPSLEDGQTD